MKWHSNILITFAYFSKRTTFRRYLPLYLTAVEVTGLVCLGSGPGKRTGRKPDGMKSFVLVRFFSLPSWLCFMHRVLVLKVRARLCWICVWHCELLDRFSRPMVMSLPYLLILRTNFASRCWIYPAFTMGRRWRSHDLLRHGFCLFLCLHSILSMCFLVDRELEL